MNINFDKLRDDIIKGAVETSKKDNAFPEVNNGVTDYIFLNKDNMNEYYQIENATEEELIEIAKIKNFDLNKYRL